MRLGDAGLGKPGLVPRDPIKKRPTCGPLIFKKSLMGRAMCCSP